MQNGKNLAQNPSALPQRGPRQTAALHTEVENVAASKAANLARKGIASFAKCMAGETGVPSPGALEARRAKPSPRRVSTTVFIMEAEDAVQSRSVRLPLSVARLFAERMVAEGAAMNRAVTKERKGPHFIA